jgi:DNA-binding NtrC family response regulator
VNHSQPQILIVDDEKLLADSLQRALKTDFAVTTAESKTTGLRALDSEPDIVLLDIRLRGADSDDRDGIELLREILRVRPGTPIVMMSALGDIETAVECMRLGAADFVKKPAGISELRQRLNRALENARVSRRAIQLQERLQNLEPAELIGESSQIQEVKRVIQMVAQDGYVTVLVTGETGTGKELVARAIHRVGRRNTEAFVPVAVSSLNSSIVESELFGHEAGAFTDARQRRIGFVEKAKGGVLFLDEVGDLPEQVQLKLLRFLEERTFTRAGSSEEQKIDVQVVAATNRNLDQAVSEGRVRKDFYYRLKSVQVLLPPLRERLEDVPALVNHFLALFRRQGRTRIDEIASETLVALGKYAWPGNVRELKAALERALIFANYHGHSSVIQEDLPLEVVRGYGDSQSPNRETALGDGVDLDLETARLELGLIEEALRKSGEHKNEAWKLLGLNDRFALRRRVLVLQQKYRSLAAEFPTIQKLYPSSAKS